MQVTFGLPTLGSVRSLSAITVVALFSLSSAPGHAAAPEDMPRHRPASHAKPVQRVAGRVLTVHRRTLRFASAPHLVEGEHYAPSLLREWNDPNLDSFGGWRLGGDTFYGDGRGDAINHGNATLGAISGYGPANGGYGGPHFDSVGGFHNAPGPDAQEDADYASGSVAIPDYGDAVPHYPSVKARVAALNTGVVPSAASARFSRASLRETPKPKATAPIEQDDENSPFLRDNDLFPDLGIDAF